MSREIRVDFEVKSMAIMKSTLDQMGITFREGNDHSLSVSRRYRDITVDNVTGQIIYDEEDKKLIEDITQEYTVNFYKDKAIREGNKFREVRKANGEVELHIVRAG